MDAVEKILERLREQAWARAPDEVLAFIDAQRELAEREAVKAARAMTAAAGAADAPPELSAIARRVERGELTWMAALRGDSADPGTARLAAVIEDRLAAVRRRIEAGGESP